MQLNNMSNEQRRREIHVSTRRLFESTSPDFQAEFRFDDWEVDHLHDCGECQHIREVFARQIIALKARSQSKSNIA
jgi:hypothetical protein